MAFFPIFLSVVFVTRNQSDQIEKILLDAVEHVSTLVSNYELIIIDNASNDENVSILKKLTDEEGIPNLQVYVLTKEVDTDTALWAGLENALGDFIVAIDPFTDDITFLSSMLDKAVNGTDIVFASNKQKIAQSFLYRNTYAIFNRLYKLLNDVNLAAQASHYRVLSKRVINFILQHSQPAVAYRHLPAIKGFTRANLSYAATPKIMHKKCLGESIDRGMRLLVSTTKAPMRLVTSLSLFGALANLIYSLYVVAIGLFKVDVAPGWVSLSLQQSGMFFLISLVLLVLGEYILHMNSSSNEEPSYYIGQEFTSAHIIQREKLNIEEVISTKNTIITAEKIES